MTLEIIGWLGSICFAVCGAPQAYKSWKDKHSNGITWGLLLLWILGEICTLIYVIPKGHAPLILNYLGNIGFVSIVIYYKICPGDLNAVHSTRTQKKN